MESSKQLTALLLISMFLVSTAASPILEADCGPCGGKPHPKPSTPKHPKTPKGPIVLPPIIKPPVVLPPVTVPPVTGVIPPVVGGIVPPIIGGIIPPVVGGIVPPVVGGIVPPVVGGIVPPIVGGTVPPPKGGSSACPPPKGTTKPATCPIDALKLGACVDLLGGLVHVGLGDPVANQCCPILGGLVELEAAVCLCTTLKLKLLNIQLVLPVALELLLTCGKKVPAGFTCSL